MEEDIDYKLLSEAENAWAQRDWSIQHILFPSMRLFFNPPSSMATDGTFVQVLKLFCDSFTLDSSIQVRLMHQCIFSVYNVIGYAVPFDDNNACYEIDF